jgi:hypothetical protein
MADWTPGDMAAAPGAEASWGIGVIRRGMAMNPKQLKKIMNRRMKAAKVLHYKRN